ncbi:MAG TPA: RagB/SusD family nutrient uptake outer membrane protein, partial [Longimicrobiales bacterium]
AANPQFIDTYDPEDTRMNGLPQDAGRGGTFLTGPQFDGQGRGYTFVKSVPNMRDNGCPGVRLRFEDGYPVWKYEIYNGETGSSDVDYPIIRYAEILMMRAEALLRTGDAAGAAALVTQVRQRAFKNSNPAKATVTGAELVQGSRYNYGWYDCDGVVKTAPGGTPVTNGGSDIQYGRFLDELGWEFAAEGHRRQDLIRFGVYTTKTWFNHAPNGTYRTVFAIPQSRLNTNPNLRQNPGY